MESFNPLHCGAVVASGTRCSRFHHSHHVSIPFIAGQWSLLENDKIFGISVAMFQSPSLRGSGRFSRHFVYPASFKAGFNPLHCGAVVASFWGLVGYRLL